MDYIVVADTDIGISKKVNQDSLCVKLAENSFCKAAMVMVCDGMGGLSNGEVASAEVVRSFSEWFDTSFESELHNWSWDRIARITVDRLKELNARIIAYGDSQGIKLGTTATGMIAVNKQYMIFHVGDTRVYKIADDVQQLTDDHTFVNREIKLGRMTREQALTDPRRNALIQCIGVTGEVSPEISFGILENGAHYLICSDGLRHDVTNEEILDILSPDLITTRSSLEARLRMMIELVKIRDEKDNISGAVLRADF